MNLSQNDRLDEETRQEIARRLQQTAGLLEHYEWPDDLLPIDPHHYMVTLVLIASEVEEKLPQANLLERTLVVAIDHFMDGDTRCRFLDAMEAKMREETDAERLGLLQLVAGVLEDTEAPLHAFPFLSEFLSTKVQEAANERARLLSAEPSERSEIASIIKRATRLEETDEEGIEASAERLAAFGDEAMPFIVGALSREGQTTLNADELGKAKALTRALGRIGGDRAIEHLLRVLAADSGETLKEEALDSLAAAGERAGRIILDMLFLGLFQGVSRVRALEALLRVGRRDFTGFVMAEFDESIWPEGQFTDEMFARLVELALSLEDKAALPQFVRMLRRKSLPPERRNYLHNRLMQTPWREEVRTALARLKEGLPVFVKRGEAQELVSGKGKKGQKSKSKAHPREEILKALDEAYHEEIGWRRPVDLRDTQARSREEMEKLQRLSERDFRAYCLTSGANPRDTGAFQEFRDWWMLERHKELGGEYPWAVMIRGNAVSRGGDAGRLLLDGEADSLYRCALEVYGAGEMERAKKRLEAVLAVLPEHALARRLLRKIEEGGAG